MDTQELHDLIDKAIEKKGPLRVPAYWMRRVLNGIVGHIDEKVKEVKSEIDIELKGKLDRAIQLTYKEFHDMCYKKAGVKGQYYHISDYKPTLSELQEEFTMDSMYKYGLYVEYNGVNIFRQFSRDYCDTVFKGYVFTDEKTYEVDYILHDSFGALNCKWMMGPLESFYTLVIRYWDPNDEVTKNVTLRNKSSIEGKDGYQYWLFEDDLTQEEYEVSNYAFENNVFSISFSVGGYTHHSVKIVDYKFRTYGSILRMKDCTQNLEVCHDFIGMNWSRGDVRELVDSKIMGYPLGLLPRVSKQGSYVVSGVEVINSDNIRIYGDYQMNSTKLRIVDCHDVYCSACDNIVLDSCRNVNISKAKDCYFIWCNDIESTTQLYSSRFWEVTAKRIEYVYDSYLYSVDADTISEVVGIGFDDVIGSHVAIKDGQIYRFYRNRNYNGATPVYPKTITSAVVDEATGKTLAELLEEMKGGTAFTSLVEIPSWELGDDGRMHLPIQYAEQVLSGNCSFMYHMLIHVPHTINGRNLVFLSYTYPSPPQGEPYLYGNMVSINIDDLSVLEESLEMDILTPLSYQELYGPYRVDLLPYFDLTTPFPEEEFTALYDAISNGRGVTMMGTTFTVVVVDELDGTSTITLTAVGPEVYSSTGVSQWSIQSVTIRSGEPIVMDKSQSLF